MGDEFCKPDMNEIDRNEEEVENENYFLNNEDLGNEEEYNQNNYRRQATQKKLKYNFYLNKQFLSSSEIEESNKYKLKQIYAINRINFLIKKIREFLNSKFEQKKNNVEELKVLLQKNQTFSNTKIQGLFKNINNNDINVLPKLTFKKNLFSYNNIVNKEINESERKNINLVRRTLYSNSSRIKKAKEGFHVIKLGENSTLYGKYSNNKRMYYSKTIFENNDILKSVADVTKTMNYGIYLYFKIGCIYEGYWENKMKSGIGIERRWDGTKYEGEYKEGKKNGIGVYIWEDHSLYFGEWLNNNIHGYGIFKNRDSSKYQGEFILNKRNGYGELTKYKNGTFFFGYWNNNKKKGFGVEFSPRANGNNKIYAGFWNGKYRHGFGIILNKIKENENTYGLWKDNKNIKSFKNFAEFKNKISSSGFSNYIPFFIKSYNDYEQIIKILVDNDEFNQYFG